MKHSFISTVVIIICAVHSLTHAQQQRDVPEGWTKIEPCNLSFYAPSDMKDLGIGGADSCVAQFANNDIRLYMDYGRYGGPPRQGNSCRECTEQSVVIDGKAAQLITYVDDTHGNSGRKYDASIYVVVKESELEEFTKTISLMMWIQGERQTDQETAQRIFRKMSLKR